MITHEIQNSQIIIHELQNSKERWVLLGGFIALLQKKNIQYTKIQFWISEHQHEQNFYISLNQQDIWYHLFKICDGIKFDAYIEEIDSNDQLINIPSFIKQESNYFYIKIYLWFNFGLNNLTKYNCKKGLLTLTNLNSSYYVLLHLKTSFNSHYSQDINQSNSLLNLFNKLIIQCELFKDLIQENYINNNIFTNMYYTNCQVLNCIEHLSFNHDFINKITIKNIINHIGKEILNIKNINNDDLNSDLLEFLIRNDNNIYSYYKINQKNFNNLPIEIWWKIMDFLDTDSNFILSQTCNTMFYIWLIYFNNKLLPHQRKSVSWLLKRENIFSNKYKNDQHWLFNNPIKYLTSSNDYFKYMSIWHFIKIKNINEIVENQYLDKIIWNESFNIIYLMGLLIHPKYMNNKLSNLLFNHKNYSKISLYFNHINKKIHIGYIPENNDYFKEEFSKTKGGIFCDEPGLGKTLTILSLIIKKTYNKSNINKDDNNNIQYPNGVYKFLFDINSNNNNNITYFLYNINSKIKLINKELINKPKDNLISSRATLIIVPNHLVQHWINEIKKWYNIDVNINNKYQYEYKKELIYNNKEYNSKIIDNNLIFPNPIYLFDDPSTDIIPDHKILSNANIVIISYRMLTKQYQLCKIKQNYERAFIKTKENNKKFNNRSELFNNEKSPILLVKWLRIIIDEGHNIGNSDISSTLYQQFIFKIKSEYKWIMSGTPLPISLNKSLNSNIPNIFNFLKLPIIFNKVIDYEDNIFENKNKIIYYNDNNSLFKKSIKTINNKFNPIGLFTIFVQLGSLIVHNYKTQCLKNYLPKLIGPNKKIIKPYINNEFFIYNMLTELIQRNLFCTYYSDENIDSLLHPNNLNYRQEVIWNLRFSSILGFTMNLKDYILDDNKLELIKYMNLSYPIISINLNDIDELYLMLINKHELYENNYFYEPISNERIELVLNYFRNLKLCNYSNKEYKNDLNSDLNHFKYYNCDSCNELLMFPLIIPCSKIHLVCVYCIMSKIGHEPIEIDLNINNNMHANNGINNNMHVNSNINNNMHVNGNINNNIYVNNNNLNSKDILNKKKYIWPYRKQIDFCVICGPEIRINPDFFDRLQVPIQIKYIEYKYDESKNLNKYYNLKDNEYFFMENNKLCNLPIIIELKNLLTYNYKCEKIEEILKKLYEKFNNITISNINNYLLNYINKNYNEDIFSINIYKDIPLISIGLIALSSSKLRYILHCILRDIKNNINIKIMVVSSFWQQLDFIYYTLTVIFNIGTSRYYPHTPKSELLSTINNFKYNKDSFVLLLSVELGSHGLDLSCVSNVYIIDPIADESIENQTISRAYRIRSNQDSDINDIRNSSDYSYVKVTYCFVQNTMEDILYDYILYKRFYEQNLLNNEYDKLNNQKLTSNIFNNKITSIDKKRKRVSTSSYSSQGGKTHIRKKIDEEILINKKNIDINHKIITKDDIYKMDSSQLFLRIFLK